MARVTGVTRPTIIRWLRKKVLRPIGATILPTTTRPEIEIAEQWSYVGNKGQVIWHWVAVERATKQVVGWVVGDRSAATCRRLWESLPADYRKRGIFIYGRALHLSAGAACIAASSASERARRDEPGGSGPQHLPPVVRQSGAQNAVVQSR
jgi:hypothetical protein